MTGSPTATPGGRYAVYTVYAVISGESRLSPAGKKYMDHSHILRNAERGEVQMVLNDSTALVHSLGPPRHTIAAGGTQGACGPLGGGVI
jgi:hypothetical protein